MKFQKLARFAGIVLIVAAVVSSPVHAFSTSWYPLGPFGGDARTLAADPEDSHHLYLGTEIGWLYDSHDAGATWTRVSQVAKQDDLVLDHILVDTKNPERLIVGTWRVGASDGGVYISEDSGKTWFAPPEMKRQSVRSMARSQSDPKMILAGTLQGIYESDDNGVHWKLISPPDSKEIHEVESLAIDPDNPKVIYAGTWHLPWKTVDGGENWVNIKQGIIDDSDVFSIIIDPKDPNVIYLSACSGIYKSSDAAEEFRKIQGIPSTARRTRKLLQDPTDLNTVYAGTTEGLYKTTDAGRTFSRMTDSNVIVNDVYVDPSAPNHVLIATDRGGVLSSDDGAASFHTSNQGFSARQVSSFAADLQNPAKVYVGVLNGKETGGVFASSDGGLKWQQQSSGLHGQDVFSLVETSTGTLLAGTGHGISRWDNDGWTDSSDILVPPSPTPARVSPAETKRKSPVRRVVPAKKAPQTKAHVHARVQKEPTSETFSRSPQRVHFLLTAAQVSDRPHAAAKKSATTHSSTKQVVTARSHAPLHKPDAAPALKTEKLDAVVYALEKNGDTVFAGTASGLLRSADDGHSWEKIAGLDDSDERFLGTREQAVFVAGLKQGSLSLDNGSTWTPVTLPNGLTQIGAVAVDDAGTLWMGGVEGVFYSTDHGATWQSLRELFLRGVDGIYADPVEHRVLVVSSQSTYVFAVHLPDNKVTYTDSGWKLSYVRPAGDHLLGATLFEGTVVQPVMMDTPFNAGEKQQ